MSEGGLRYEERVSVARLHALLELLPRVLDQGMAEVGLTSFEFTLLEALHEAPDHRLRMSALASRTNATLPRLSRVVTGLEKRGLVVRAACAEDGRATNAVLTDGGERVHLDARPVYERVVRSFVLADLDDADVADLSRLTFAILSRLDPDRRMAVTAESPCAADPAPKTCAADPAPTNCGADPAPTTCAADPAPTDAADPQEKACPADPAPIIRPTRVDAGR